MSLTVDAIYEAGVFRPLVPLPNLQEREHVRLTLETVGGAEDALRLINEQRQNRIQIDPELARTIGDNNEHNLFES